MDTQPEKMRLSRVCIPVAILLALAVGVGIGFVFGRATQPVSLVSEVKPLVQEGALTPPVTPELSGWRGPVEVFYPVPYASPPELTFPIAPRRFEIKEQRADGFKVQITECGTEQTPTWRAKGLPPN
jgi:hypothetical protein